LKDNELDLQCDPISIYKQKLREEEITTGEKSTRTYEVTADVAAQDPEVQAMQLKNFEKLKTITDKFLAAIVKSAPKMPFGIRYISMKIKEKMTEKFPGHQNENSINIMVGNMLYYRYMNPVIVAPEAFDIIETAISPAQRKNLAEVAKTIHQISACNNGGKINASGNNLLAPSAYQDMLNEYVQQSGSKFNMFLKEGLLY
jgi:hypothetical protein